ncbi:MAG: septal ring lytic transglycosylase RlpA family protein [Ignavibacteriaceae bacterium]
MNKLKLLLPLIMLLTVTGLTLIPSKINNIGLSDLTQIEIAKEANLSSHSQINIKYIDLGSMNASWYGPRFHGRLTANGEIYDQMGYTAAHKSLPFGTLLRLTNRQNHKSIIVRINDRGPYIPGRKIDLSKKVAIELGAYEKGVVKLDVEKVVLSGIDKSVLN